MKKKKEKGIIKFLPIFIIILFAIILFFLYFEYDCKNDISCYNSHLKECKGAKLNIIEDGSNFLYQIQGKEKNTCKIKVTLLDMPSETDQETINLFKEKFMICNLELNATYDVEILPYCTGPLKEAIYELTISKMYNILAQSLGDIISEI